MAKRKKKSEKSTIIEENLNVEAEVDESEENVTQSESAIFDTEEQRSPFLKVFLSVLVIVLLVTGAYLLFKKGGKTEKVGPTKVEKMQKLAAKIDTMKSEVNTKQNEIFDLITQYKTQGGSDIPTYDSMNLSEEEKQLLEKRIAAEEDNSIKSLLNSILEKNREISDLNKKIAEIEMLLPKPHIVKKGENHFNLAIGFLINDKGLDEKEAKKLAERAGMFENLVPGFRVWNFYDDGIYGTFVTQGSAPISPNQVNRLAKKILVDAKDKAISERDQLASELEILEQKKIEIINQLALLNTEKRKLIDNISALSKRNEAFKIKVNSLFYRLDTKVNLKEKGIIKGGFLRKLKIRDYKPEDFNHSIDLRSESKVLVNAVSFKLKKIKNLIVYPRFLKKDKDFKIIISPDNQNAELIILNKDKLKNERIVISII